MTRHKYTGLYNVYAAYNAVDAALLSTNNTVSSMDGIYSYTSLLLLFFFHFPFFFFFVYVFSRFIT